MARWNIDPAHSNIEFAVRHMMVSTVKGSFSNPEGYIEFDPAAPQNARVEASVKAETVNTRTNDRDAHLRSPDFFDAANYPDISFKSNKVELKDATHALVTGDLTIRGVTKQVTFEAEFFGVSNSPFGDVRAGFNATTKINREDFGLTWNQALEAGGVLVGKEVTLNLDIEGIKVAETQPA